MAKPSPLNPLRHIIERQYRDDVFIKNNIFKQRLANARNLYRKDLLAHYGCVNAIEFSTEGNLLVSGGDDRRVLLWSVPQAMFGTGCPFAMETNHISNIFCLAFDSDNTKIFSGGNDDQVIIHDAITGRLVGKLAHRKPVYGLSVNPQDNHVMATASDDGRILLFDVREPFNADPLCLAKQKTGFHSVMFNPINPRWLATANSEEGIAMWDCRKPKEQLMHFDANLGKSNGISACFNSAGDRILALRRRLPPVLYSTQKENAVCQFYHPQYYNSCTMKTCCFAGDDDEYVVSGSDDFNLYMWNTPIDDSIEWGKSHLVLRGHRSIVNQVRYNKETKFLASSGVEKMVKLWSSLPIGTWNGSLQNEESDVFRSTYTHDEYVYMIGTTERISHDYSDHSTQEDSKMMAFFDSLIQREIDGWNDPSSEDSELSDSDSDTEKNVAKILSEMFCNGPIPQEEAKKLRTNKIAQLIAKKRSHLARMAHRKAPSQVGRYQLKEKTRKKKTPQKSKSKLKKTNKKSCKPPEKDVDSEAEKNVETDVEKDVDLDVEKDVRKKVKKPIGKKAKKNSPKQKHVPEGSKPRKYRTRQSVRECNISISDCSYDAPSTSTGITSSSNSVYRLFEQDSDEEVPPNNNNCTENGDPEENNLVSILPTPLNGTHDLFINILEMTNTNGNVVTVRNDEYNQASSANGATDNVTIDIFEDSCASTSTSGVGIRGVSCSVDTFDSYVFVNESESDSDFDCNYRTPVKKRRTVSASDSGCGTGPCSSTSPYPRNRIHQECSSNGIYNNDRDSDEEYKYEKFKKRVSKARFNIRKQIGADSDSN